MEDAAEIVVIGAGAAGLMAAIRAGRTGAGQRIIAVDGARVIGAKILVAGGGRCNVTHDFVDETSYAGSSRNAIKKVLRRFDVGPTTEFFRALGVELKREETGKLFPVTDDAHTVLEALLGAVRAAGVELRHPWRVGAVRRAGDGFEIEREGEVLRARRVILATGGMALPRSGSDGQGYSFARALGHTITERVFPALVPLTLPKGHFLCALSGVAAPATVELREASGKKLVSFTGPLLCTHFGVSGPAVMDISRYVLDRAGRAPVLVVNWLPAVMRDGLDGDLVKLGARSVGRFLAERLPERLAHALCREAGVDGAAPGHGLTREQRKAVVGMVCEMPLPVTGDRGFSFAEATAGGVPLSELHLETMESRVCPGLYLCGEVCDVDGRIGGYNFQWAWASGFVAGGGAAKAAAEARAS